MKLKDHINDYRYAIERQVFSNFHVLQWLTTHCNIQYTASSIRRLLATLIIMDGYGHGVDCRVKGYPGQMFLSSPWLTVTRCLIPLCVWYWLEPGHGPRSAWTLGSSPSSARHHPGEERFIGHGYHAYHQLLIISTLLNLSNNLRKEERPSILSKLQTSLILREQEIHKTKKHTKVL